MNKEGLEAQRRCLAAAFNTDRVLPAGVSIPTLRGILRYCDDCPGNTTAGCPAQPILESRVEKATHAQANLIDRPDSAIPARTPPGSSHFYEN